MFSGETAVFTKNKHLQSLEIVNFKRINALAKYFADMVLIANPTKTQCMLSQAAQTHLFNPDIDIHISVDNAVVSKTLTFTFWG